MKPEAPKTKKASNTETGALFTTREGFRVPGTTLQQNRLIAQVPGSQRLVISVYALCKAEHRSDPHKSACGKDGLQAVQPALEKVVRVQGKFEAVQEFIIKQYMYSAPKQV